MLFFWQLKCFVCGTYSRRPNALGLLLLYGCLAQVVGQKVAPRVELHEVGMTPVVQFASLDAF